MTPDPTLGGRDVAASPSASLHEAVLSGLRDYIADGHLPDGARVPERALCERFAISRTPLREALKVLASEGLVDLLPHRGARTRTLSARDIEELFDVMGGLEALAGRLACERMAPDEFDAIEALHHTMYGHFLRRDSAGYFACNQKIHGAIVAAARNVTLDTAYANIGNRVRRIRYSANLTAAHERWSTAMREHEAILDALRMRDGDALARLLFAHLRSKRAAAIDHLAGPGSAGLQASRRDMTPADARSRR